MMRYSAILFLILFTPLYIIAQPGRRMVEITPAGKGKVDTRIDNMGYWSRMVKLGYVLPAPKKEIPPAIFTGSEIRPDNQSGTAIQNSPDIPVTGEEEVTQSENSLFIDPQDENVVLNSNNSSSWIMGFAEDRFGADALYSLTAGENWQGSVQGVNGSNAGDPSTSVGRNGWWYVGRITADYGQAVSYSKDQGKTWTRVKVGNGPTAGVGLLDKNHLWIDNSTASPYEGYIYNAWTNFIPGSPDTNQIQVVRSTNHGLNWSSPFTVSTAAGALKLNHGVNIQTGPDGEVYLAWSIYDTWPSDENAIGFCKSIDGGAIFTPAIRVISNLKGIRASFTAKDMRVNAFPSMAVDNSNGPHRGTVYMVFSNIGYPGINTGSDIDVYLIRSTDEGETWSAPLKVNQDPAGLGKQHFFPWITCDPVTGGLCVIYYDDRNLPATDVSTWVSYSYDGGMTWSDMQVSDYSFTPTPIAGLAFSYFGDYIGIQSNNMQVYPVWTDNHESGRAMSYTSPFFLGPNPGQPWVMYHSDSLAPVAGTGPVTLNNGDSLFLSLGLKNVGDQPANHLTAYLSSPSPYILITDSVAFYDTIGPGIARNVTNGYTLRVSDTIPDNLPVRFNVRTVSPDSTAFTWHSHFSLEAHAPALKINSLSVVDGPPGNQNGRLDPGENVTLIISTSNTGDFPCTGTYGLLTSASPYLTLQSDSVFMDVIPAGQYKLAQFQATVGQLVPPGAGVDLHYRVKSGNYDDNAMFREMIGQFVEDWESNTFSKFAWMPGGIQPWSITDLNPYEGLYSARSGNIDDYQNSQLIVEYTSAVNDSISFYLKTSSEQDYDYLMFAIDNVMQGQWSGDTPWSRVAFPVAAGTHVFKWLYLKDLAYAYGLDRVWIDYIAFPPPALPSVNPGNDTAICAGSIAWLNGQVAQADSVRWSTTGDGTFTLPTSPETYYMPGQNDISAGTVNLILTAFGGYGSSAASRMLQILTAPPAVITAYPGDTACAGQQIILMADTMGVSSYTWLPGNQHTASIAIDTSSTGGVGSFSYVLRTLNATGCTGSDTAVVVFKDCTGVEEPDPASLRVYPNPGNGRFLLELPPAGESEWLITVVNSSGSEVFRDHVSPLYVRFAYPLNLGRLAEGVYLLSVTGGDLRFSTKLVIQR